MVYVHSAAAARRWDAAALACPLRLAPVGIARRGCPLRSPVLVAASLARFGIRFGRPFWYPLRLADLVVLVGRPLWVTALVARVHRPR